MADYDPSSDVGRVRLLLNDTDPLEQVFSDSELGAFLALEGGNVKLAAAQAIDTNADNEALASKVITTRDGSVNGASLAAALHARAAMLREQAYASDDDQGFFEIIPRGCGWTSGPVC